MGISRNPPQPPIGCWESILGIPTFLGSIMMPHLAYIPNPQISPHLPYLARWEISTPSGLEFPPSLAPGILPQGTQQRSVSRDPFATYTPESCSHSSPVFSTWVRSVLPHLHTPFRWHHNSPQLQLLACLELSLFFTQDRAKERKGGPRYALSRAEEAVTPLELHGRLLLMRH